MFCDVNCFTTSSNQCWHVRAWYTENGKYRSHVLLGSHSLISGMVTFKER